MIDESKLDFWIQNNLNVLFTGKHGVGKTSVIIKAFERAGLKWKYFSAATLDPWVDVIGVPRPVKLNPNDPDSPEYLDLIRPKEFATDDIQAIFVDELNRSHKKIRNAMLELIQFKSINGKKFNNLQLIWGAINPDDEERYDVEKLDQAQIDRFHIHVNVDYKCYKPYFDNKFGSSVSDAAISWWNELPSDVKDKVSPRRLDYALEVHKLNGDLRDVLPKESNIGKLLSTLDLGPISAQLKSLIRQNDATEIRKWLLVENNFSSAIQHILDNNVYLEFFLPFMSDEKVSSLLNRNKVIKAVIRKRKDGNLENVFRKYYFNSLNGPQRIKMDRLLVNNGWTDFHKPKTVQSVVSKVGSYASNNSMCMHGVGHPDWSNYLSTVKQSLKRSQTYDRIKIYKDIEQHLPDVLDIDQAKETLSVLNYIASSSHDLTIKNKMTNIFKLANHCCKCLKDHGYNFQLRQIAGRLVSKAYCIGKSGELLVA